MKKEQTIGLLVLGSVVVFLITLSAVLPGPRVGFQPGSSVTTSANSNLDDMNKRRIKSQGQKHKVAKSGQRSRMDNELDFIDPTVEKPKTITNIKQGVSTGSSMVSSVKVQTTTKNTTNFKTPKQFVVASKQNRSSQLSAKMRSMQRSAKMRRAGRYRSGVIQLFEIMNRNTESLDRNEATQSLKVNSSK